VLFPRLHEPDDREALRVDASSLSYRALARACARHLDRLRDLSIREGDRVAVWTDPSLETAVALAAHACGGIVSVPLNPKLGARELAHVLADAQPKAIVGIEAARERASLPFAIARVDPSGSDAIEALAVDASPLLLLYTSGTTGAPKGASITRANVAFDLDALADAWAWTVFDTVVHALPLFHVHGLVLGLFGSLRAGGTLAWQSRFEPAPLARALRAGQTVLFAVPTMIHRLAEAAENDAEVREGLAAARLLISGSAGLPLREHRRIEALSGRGVLERYGLTETLINTGVRADDAPMPGSVGRALSGVELALVDDERRTIDAYDGVTIGEIAVRGPNVFAGYWNRPDATSAVIDAHGYFHTGDLATRARDGSIRIVGRRATDLIKSGGFKIGAGEIEAALLEDPSVAEAAVIGVPDDDLGERIVAFVVARSAIEPEALIERVASELAPHKRPREIRLVDALPRNAMGKVIKSELGRS
jgi:malonyl-CoA/methylmalonyl-CoA synthetase